MTERTMAERDAQRADGWYWVQDCGAWNVAEWVGEFKHWWVARWEAPITSANFDAINETRLEPPATSPLVPIPATAPR